MRRPSARYGLLGLLLCALAVGIGAAAPDGGDPLQLVTDIYRRALAAHDPNRAGRAVETEEEFLSHFTPATRALWVAASKAPSPEGPILNAWFGPNALPGTVGLGALRLSDKSEAAAEIEVALTVRAEARLVRVELVRSGPSWLVANVRYPGDDLGGYLERKLRQ